MADKVKDDDVGAEKARAEGASRTQNAADVIGDASAEQMPKVKQAQGYYPTAKYGSRQYAKGGIVGPNVLKWGSPKVTAPCADSKTLKCY